MKYGQSFTFSGIAEQGHIHFMNCGTVLSRTLMRYGDSTCFVTCCLCTRIEIT